MSLRSVALLVWVSAAFAHVARNSHHRASSYSRVDSYTSPVPPSLPLLARDEDDPTDFGWVRRWAAIGDSFTAGIGSGRQTGLPLSNNWKCSRYTYSWPAIVNHALGPSVSDFQFAACSGDRSEGIYHQAQAIEGELDLVMMTAGGNDLCLVRFCVECPSHPPLIRRRKSFENQS